jgi:hypothetical protein
MVDAGAPKIKPDEWVDKLYSRWSPHPVNVVYLNRFLELAASKQIPVYWLLPPIHPELQARIDASQFDLACTAFIRDVQNRFPGMVVVDGRHAGFSADLFTDGVHVNRRGALKLSAELAVLLCNRIGVEESNMWVALNLPPAKPVDFPIEDVYQSAMSLRAERTAIRR